VLYSSRDGPWSCSFTGALPLGAWQALRDLEVLRLTISRWYAGKIRHGYRPHPRHWEALVELVSVSSNAS
jgi:hypothetical protein